MVVVVVVDEKGVLMIVELVVVSYYYREMLETLEMIGGKDVRWNLSLLKLGWLVIVTMEDVVVGNEKIVLAVVIG